MLERSREFFSRSVVYEVVSIPDVNVVDFANDGRETAALLVLSGDEKSREMHSPQD